MSPIHCLRQAVRCHLVYEVAVKGKQGVLREISVDRQTPRRTLPAGGLYDRFLFLILILLF